MEEQNQIWVYIRNYNENNELVENPNDALTTYIDVEEQREYDEHQYIDTSYKILEPHKLNDTHFLKSFLLSYFDSYNGISKNNNKVLFVKYHFSKNYKYYNAFNKEVIDKLKSMKYESFNFDLENQKFEIDDSFIFSFDNFSIKNAKIFITCKEDISINCKDFTLENVEIINKLDDKSINILSTGNIYFREIVFSDKLVYFNIHGNTEEINKWIKNSVKIFNFSYNNINYDYDNKMNSVIKIENFNNVIISEIAFNVKKFNISAIRVYNVNILNINRFIITTSYKYEKSIVSLENIGTLTISNSTATQESKQNDNIYFFIITKGDESSIYSFNKITVFNLGLFSLLNDYSYKISVYACECNNSLIPISYISSVVSRIIISNSAFNDNIQMKIAPNEITIFDSLFQIKELEFSGNKKIFISNTNIKSDTFKITNLEEGNTLIENSNFKFKEINIEGNKNSANISINSTYLSGNKFITNSINNISTVNSNFEIKELSIKSSNISDFSPYILNNKIEKIELQGKMNEVAFYINNSISKKLILDILNSTGELLLKYINKIPRKEITIDNSKIYLLIESDSEEDNEIETKLTSKNNSIGSIICSYTKNIKYNPQTDGDFAKLKYFDSKINLEDIKRKTEYRESVSYGYN